MSLISINQVSSFILSQAGKHNKLNKIETIKNIRNYMGLSLKDAKHFYETTWEPFLNNTINNNNNNNNDHQDHYKDDVDISDIEKRLKNLENFVKQQWSNSI